MQEQAMIETLILLSQFDREAWRNVNAKLAAEHKGEAWEGLEEGQHND